MKRRQKMNRKKSKKLFTNTAGSHPRNRSNPMRGGIRM